MPVLRAPNLLYSANEKPRYSPKAWALGENPDRGFSGSTYYLIRPSSFARNSKAFWLTISTLKIVTSQREV